MFPGKWRACWCRGRRPAEAGRGRVLRHAFNFYEGIPRLIVLVLRRFLQVKHGRETDIRVLHNGTPFRARLCLENFGDLRFEFRPVIAIVLIRIQFIRQFRLLKE